MGRKFVVFVLCLYVSGTASAAVFDFSGSLGTADSMEFFQDGVGLRVMGLAGSTAVLVHQDEDGLGVTYEGDRASYTSASQVDGRDELESLILTFSAPVSFSSVTFSLVGSNDQFSLLVDDLLLFEGDIPSGRTKGFSANNTGQVFTFGTGEDDDDYKVKGVEVGLMGESDPEVEPGSDPMPDAVVPEPTSMILMGIGLAGAAFRRRRIK